MKKTLLSIAILSTILTSAFALNQPIVSGTPCTYPCAVPPSYNFTAGYVEFFDPSGNPVLERYGDGGTINSAYTGIGTWHIVTYNSPSFCYASTFSQCLANYTSALYTSYTILDPNASTIDGMLKNATSSFMGTLGFLPSDGVKSVGSLFIMPIIGGGVMMFQSLMPWIIALVVLSAFVYFSYRAFRFYKH